MHPLIQLKKAAPVFLVALVCFGFLPTMQAVTPAPDGFYPGRNTAEGKDALFSLTTGVMNTAVGFDALYFNNVGSNNTATGFASLFRNTTGDFNTANGLRALYNNTTGHDNTANGFQALRSNVSGTGNTATGSAALFSNTTVGALSGDNNTAVGFEALTSNTTGHSNTAVGSQALLDNQGNLITTGHSNTAVGFQALLHNQGNFNIALGNGAGDFVVNGINVICIGADGADVNNSCYIRNIWQQPGGSQAVFVNAAGKLGFQVSSRRFKDEIKAMEQASEILYGLKPVSFRYKPEIEPTRPLGFGLIAEEVEEISPDLVTRDGNGKVSTVRYDAVNAMLLNEFLKEHRTVQELKSAAVKQEAMIASQQKQIEALTAGLQKVSAQLEASKPAPQVVNNP